MHVVCAIGNICGNRWQLSELSKCGRYVCNITIWFVIQKPSKFGRSYWVLDMLICSKLFAHSRADRSMPLENVNPRSGELLWCVPILWLTLW
jgi:hypothetical protein